MFELVVYILIIISYGQGIIRFNLIVRKCNKVTSGLIVGYKSVRGFSGIFPYYHLFPIYEYIVNDTKYAKTYIFEAPLRQKEAPLPGQQVSINYESGNPDIFFPDNFSIDKKRAEMFRYFINTILIATAFMIALRSGKNS